MKIEGQLKEALILNAFYADEMERIIADLNSNSGLTLSDIFMLGVEFGSLFETDADTQEFEDGEIYSKIDTMMEYLTE